MRPGPHPWATNNAYAAGPDAGSDSKTETTAALRADGYYRTRRPAPDLLNWQLNRDYLAHQFAAKMFASNMRLEVTSAGFVNDTMDGSTSLYTVPYTTNLFYFFDGGGNLNELQVLDGYGTSAPASNPISAAAGVVTAIDADADDSTGDRVIACVSGATDQVYLANGFGGGAWGFPAGWPGGGPGLNWQAIGCDRNTAGGANALWLIGDDQSGANAVLYSSTNGCANVANVATFPAVAEPILFIGHTCHPAGALGSDDAGNPSWLVLTTTRALVSADGATWSNQAHGFGVAPSKKSCAYSRTAGRWVFCDANDIWYSDDNGATWTALAAAMPEVAASPPVSPMQVKCDGYGTFMICDDTLDAQYWVSADDGLTWSSCIHASATGGWDSKELEVGWYSADNWNDHGASPTHFTIGFNDIAAPLQEFFCSLRY